MSLTLGGVLGDARILWRRERELLVPIAGLFFVVPMLGAILILGGSGFPPQGNADQVREAFLAIYTANMVPILAINLALDFGSFAVFNLFLQGGGRTLGEVLMLTLRRFPLFFLIDLIAGLLFSIGASLLIVPGLFVFARTWLAGPAFAAVPEAGVTGAFREGWRRSGGLGGFALLGVAALVFLATLALVMVSSIVLGLAGALVGGGQVVTAIGYLVTALVGGMAWTMLAVLRVAAYRRGEPRQGI